MNLVNVVAVATLGADELAVASDASTITSEKGIICEELGASLITGLN